jgi:hypothetical protein
MDDRKYSSSQHERFSRLGSEVSRLGSEAAPARAVGAWTCCWVFTGVCNSLHQPGRIPLSTKGNSVTGFD